MATIVVPIRKDTAAAGAVRRPRPGMRPGRVAAWAMLVVLLAVTLFPFYWMVVKALTPNRDIYVDYGLWPKVATLSNFKRVLGLATPEEAGSRNRMTIPFGGILINSVVFTAVVAVSQVFFSALAAYAFARLRWRGRNVVFALFLSGLMVPPIFGILPNFLLVKELNWVNTWQGLLAPYLLMSPFAIFFLRQFFLNIPDEVEEAARLDGAGSFRIFWSVIAPMSKAPINTLLAITTVFAWNEYLWPLLVADNANAPRLLTAALGSFVKGSPQDAPDWAGFMAVTAVSVAPLVVFMLVFGRRLVTSLQFSSGGK